MRVLVCDDSAVMRRVIREIIESDPANEVLAVARNGKQCIELALQLKPDLITLDIEMPVMNGLDALRRIMSECPTHVIMVSSLTVDGSRESMRALRLGAADVVAKDHSGYTDDRERLTKDILERVRALATSKRRPAPHPEPASRSTHSAPPARGMPDVPPGAADLIVIGSSTGGPPVLEHVLTGVPASCPIPIVVAQHMPRLFTESMSHRLDEVCNVPVVHLDPGVVVEPGRVHIAPGGLNAHLKPVNGRSFRVRIDREPASTVYFPSVDELFASAADAAGGRTLGVILTGMGADGAKGAARIRSAGGWVVAQDEASCVVYGMPRAAVENGSANVAAAPDAIRSFLAGVCSVATRAA